MAGNANKGEMPRRLPNGQFPPKTCGNPKGRPKGAKGLLKIFNEKRDEKLTVTRDGRKVRLSRMEIWVENLWNEAMTIDPKASMIVLNILKSNGQFDPEPQDEGNLAPGDAAVLEALIQRLAGKKKDEPDE